MKKFKSHFKFNKQEQSGIFFLLLLIVFVQVGYLFYKSMVLGKLNNPTISVNKDVQHQINILKQQKLQKETLRIFLFNPNFITDNKGYTLGMSLEEINRLHAFRAQNKFVNSIEEFQKVSLVSDSLLDVISPFFKFPDWVNTSLKNDKSFKIKTENYQKKDIVSVIKQDLNSAMASDLKIISGIGDKLSERIIKFRDKLGGFLVDEQLYDVYGLAPEVIEKALNKFTVIDKPTIIKININTCTVAELSKLVYFNYALSQNILRYREEKNGIQSFEELNKIEGFPSDKIDRISLYLLLKKEL